MTPCGGLSASRLARIGEHRHDMGGAGDTAINQDFLTLAYRAIDD